jgi:NTP pyrophosphatase (non-canonical NTP hydrolase)
MDFKYIENKVIEWAKDRLIFEQSSDIDQMKKLIEEFSELDRAVNVKNLKLIIDGIGDMLVVLTLIAKFNNIDLFQCYCAAYLEIKDRRGKMINGLFVKE